MDKNTSFFLKFLLPENQEEENFTRIFMLFVDYNEKSRWDGKIKKRTRRLIKVFVNFFF